MPIDLRTRVELTCWNLIIPMMTKLRSIRSTTQPKELKPFTGKQFVIQVLVWCAAGLLIGFGLSSIRALIW
jgi:hypothetical protein